LNFEKIDGPLTIRARESGDVLRLPSGSRSLKKLMIDRKIPAADRSRIPVLTMGDTVLAVHSLGIHREYLPVPGRPILAISLVPSPHEV
jgi:tRNA(Ile)-lysidine synthase